MPPLASTHRHRWLTWLCAVCLLAMALLPGFVHAAASRAAGPDWVLVCTAQGMRWVSLSGATDAPPEALSPAEPCTVCQLQAHNLGLLPEAPAAPALQPLRFAQPLLFWHAPRTLAVWRHALSRGPPAA